MEFRILGPLEVLDDGTSVELGAPKQRAVLAILLLYPNQVVSTDRLVESVWGEDAPRTADHSIQIYVSELRKAFDPEGEMLVTRRPGYELRVDPESIDARRFECLVGESAAAQKEGDDVGASAQAAEALGMWRGSALADFVYDEFAQREIERLDELHHRAVTTICEAHVHEGTPLEAVPMLRDEVAKDPLREAPRRLLMLALFAGGRQAEALREFRDYRDTLAEETGLDPSPGLLRLEEQILLRDPSLTPGVEEAEKPQAAERNPYKGLRPFGEADAADFFGRDDLIENLFAASAARLTAVVGPSGSGKSSVVRAGLIPALRSDSAEKSDDLAVATFIPGRFPFAEFDAAMGRLPGSPSGPSDPGDDTSIAQSVLRSLPTESAEMLLVIDQFEELFTLTDEPTRRAFLRNLVNAVKDPHGRIRVLLMVRGDFYDRPLVYPEFADFFTENVVNVTPLKPVGIEAAAVEPARRVGVGFAPDLLAEVVSDMADQPGALPLFQYTLTELFDERDDSLMSLDAYERIGGLAGTLSRRADAVYDSLGPDEQETARQVFLHLVKPTEDRYTRRPVPVLELEAVGEAAAVSAVLTRFGEERLLTFDRDWQTGAATAELSHEALLDGWMRLAGWLEEARFDITQLDGLIAAAAEWETVERDPGYLLTGARLADYEAWSEAITLTLPPIAAAYLAESVEARHQADKAEAERLRREEKATRHARVRLWGMLAAVVALVAVTTFMILTVLANRPPPVALVYSGPDEGGWNDQNVAALERAEADFGVEIGYVISSADGLAITMAEIAESGTAVVLNGFGSVGAESLSDVVPANRDTEFVLPDIAVPRVWLEELAAETPNGSFPLFAAHEGSFLVGVAAASMTETGVVGFVGVVDHPTIAEFQAGFEAGVEYFADVEGKDIEIVVVNLSTGSELLSVFDTRILAEASAREIYDLGADVVYGAVGSSGRGILEAAYDVSATTGIHRWHIGVDVDEWARIDATDRDPTDPYDPHRLLPHILTSMVKNLGLPMYDAIEDYANGEFTSGVIPYGVANHGVDYARSGGHLPDDVIEELEDLRLKIGSEEIVVPILPEGMELPGPGE
ncbi:MAG: BTAD domain-containing putative transcriptional regulator [Actinomycetota bacterium]